jgi:hypothetical protein
VTSRDRARLAVHIAWRLAELALLILGCVKLLELIIGGGR